jgi:GNAT superfamily N-acetyltransferase
VKIKKYSNEKLNEAKKIIYKNYLYVPTWSFTSWMKEKFHELKSIYILFENEKPIGSCLVLNTSSYFDVNIGIFIKPNYRKKGYGKQLLRFAIRNNKNFYFRYSSGIKGSLTFFEKAKKNLDNVKNLQ